MNKKILLSKNKIEELTRELEDLKYRIKHFHEYSHDTILSSMMESVSFEVTVKSKQKKLHEIETILLNTSTLPEKIKSKKVLLGSWVKVKNNTGAASTYRIVHPIEADPSKHFISIESELGKLLINNKKGYKYEFNSSNYYIIRIY